MSLTTSVSKLFAIQLISMHEAMTVWVQLEANGASMLMGTSSFAVLVIASINKHSLSTFLPKIKCCFIFTFGKMR